MVYNEPRIVGEGSYGCVVYPPVSCLKTDTSPVDKNRVGKIFRDKHQFKKEVRFSEKIEVIDPEHTSFLPILGTCSTSIENVMDHPVAYRCDNVKKSTRMNARFHQILMPYGGNRIDKYFAAEKHTPVRSFVHITQPLIEGIQKLQQKGYCHQDIKLGNILVTSTGRAMYIDFSLMIKLKDVFHSGNARKLKHSYFVYPLEYKVFYCLEYAPRAYTVQDIYQEYLKNLGDYQKLYANIHPNMHKEAVQFIKWAQKLKRTDHDRFYQTFQGFAAGVDVFSLGATFLRLQKYMNKKDTTYTTLIDIIRHMTNIDPRRRYSIDDVAREYAILS